jgi:hypothetical protein
MRRNLIYTCILLRFIYTKVRFRIKLPNLPKYENNYILTAKSLSEIGHVNKPLCPWAYVEGQW